MSKKRKKREKRRERGAAAKRRAEQHESGYEPTAIACPEGTERFKEKITKKPYRLDIIPFRLKENSTYADKGEVYFEKTFWVHWLGEGQGSYVCLSRQLGRKCPICDFREKQKRDVDADEKLIKDLAPKQRQLWRVIDLQNKDKGIQLWDISFHNFGKQLDARILNSDEEDNYREFYELEKGFTLKVGFAEKSFGSGKPYPEASSIDFKPRDEDYDEDILEEGPDLDECIIIKDYDELKNIFLQTTDDDDDDDDNDDDDDDDNKKPDKKKKSKKAKKKKEEEPEDDDNGDNNGSKWNEEDRVIVEIDGDDYAGEITEIDDDEETVSIKYDDGDTADDVSFEDLTTEPEKKTSKKKKKDKDKKEKGEKSKKNKCPHGHKFGEDTDDYDDCDDCEVWDKCDSEG